MSDLKWLRDLSEGRTPGPWKAKIRWDGLGSIEPEVIESVIGGTLIGEHNGRFIAAAGTLWDKLVDVAEAVAADAELCRFCDLEVDDDATSCTCTRPLQAPKALAALQATRKEIE